MMGKVTKSHPTGHSTACCPALNSIGASTASLPDAAGPAAEAGPTCCASRSEVFEPISVVSISSG